MLGNELQPGSCFTRLGFECFSGYLGMQAESKEPLKYGVTDLRGHLKMLHSKQWKLLLCTLHGLFPLEEYATKSDGRVLFIACPEQDGFSYGRSTCPYLAVSVASIAPCE